MVSSNGDPPHTTSESNQLENTLQQWNKALYIHTQSGGPALCVYQPMRFQLTSSALHPVEQHLWSLGWGEGFKPHKQAPTPKHTYICFIFFCSKVVLYKSGIKHPNRRTNQCPLVKMPWNNIMTQPLSWGAKDDETAVGKTHSCSSSRHVPHVRGVFSPNDRKHARWPFFFFLKSMHCNLRESLKEPLYDTDAHSIKFF